MRKVLALAALALALAAPAQAQPNFLGSTGLLLTPTSDTVGGRRLAGHAHFTDNFDSFGVLGGVTEQLEIGVSYLDLQGGDEGFLVNAKFALLTETTVTPGIAVGVIDLFDELNADPSWYVVASKGFPNFIPALGGLRFHAGFGGGIYDEDFFFGAEMGLGTPLDLLPIDHPRFTLVAEYLNSDVNLGIRARWRGLSATAALFDLDDFGFGVTYTTGLPQ